MLSVCLDERPAPCASDFLRGLPLFRALDDAAIRRLATATSEIDAPRATIVLRQGDACAGLHVVVRGRVKLSIETQRGDEKIMALLGPRTHFGDPPFYARQRCTATVESVVDSSVLCIAKDAILREISLNPAFALHVIEDLAQRLCQRTKDIESYTLHTGTQRLIDYLLSEEPESTHNGVRHVTLPERKGIIASRLSLTQEHLSRILRDLAARKLIDMHGPRVLIPDVAKLQRART